MEANLPIIKSNPQDIKPIPFDIKPLEGYEIHKNKKTGEVFPNCCSLHKSYKAFVEYWHKNTFPQIKELTSKSWFKKEDFGYLPEKILKQISYIEHFINEKIKDENWFDEITNYIDYNQFSFGKVSVGFSVFKYILLNFLRTEDCLQDYSEKTIELIKYLELGDYFEDFTIRHKTPFPNGEFNEYYLISSEIGKNKGDFIGAIKLKGTYDKWKNAIPDWAFFEDIKKSIFPFNLFYYKPIFNPYTKITKTHERPIPKIIELLHGLTLKLINSFDLVELRMNGVITNKKKYQLELKIALHRTRKSKKYGNYLKEETKYLNIIKEWLSDELAFFKDIESEFDDMPKILSGEEINPNTSPKSNNSKAKDSKIYTVHWALFYFYLQRAELMDWFENMEEGKVKAIQKLCEENENLGSAKNFELHYNKISKLKIRLTRKNIANIKLTITLISDYPKALEIAQNDIKEIEKQPYRD